MLALTEWSSCNIGARLHILQASSSGAGAQLSEFLQHEDHRPDPLENSVSPHLGPLWSCCAARSSS